MQTDAFPDATVRVWTSVLEDRGLGQKEHKLAKRYNRQANRSNDKCIDITENPTQSITLSLTLNRKSLQYCKVQEHDIPNKPPVVNDAFKQGIYF